MNDSPPDSPNPAPEASVVIPTWNRKDDLALALASLMNQTVPLEIIVMDDGSDDGTQEMIRDRFPSIIYHRHKRGNGPTALRKKGIGLASCEIVFPFDNDIELVHPATVEQAIREFEHPRVGAVAVPYIERSRDPDTVLHRPPSDDGLWVLDRYMGAVSGLRRSMFLKLGGYRSDQYYYGEESDLAIRMLAAGYVIRAGQADPIHHIRSTTSRPSAFSFEQGRINGLLLPWHYAPLRYLLPHWASTVRASLVVGVKSGQLGVALRGLVKGWGACLGRRRHRRPVSVPIYRLWTRLRRQGPRRLEDIEHYLVDLDQPVSPDLVV
ncbi:MAG: glycosyltransferase family A protein [Planctomycetota bacterium]